MYVVFCFFFFFPLFLPTWAWPDVCHRGKCSTGHFSLRKHECSPSRSLDLRSLVSVLSSHSLVYRFPFRTVDVNSGRRGFQTTKPTRRSRGGEAPQKSSNPASSCPSLSAVHVTQSRLFVSPESPGGRRYRAVPSSPTGSIGQSRHGAGRRESCDVNASQNCALVARSFPQPQQQVSLNDGLTHTSTIYRSRILTASAPLDSCVATMASPQLSLKRADSLDTSAAYSCRIPESHRPFRVSTGAATGPFAWSSIRDRLVRYSAPQPTRPPICSLHLISLVHSRRSSPQVAPPPSLFAYAVGERLQSSPYLELHQREYI
ncbi:hypothetical protein BV25DRAFT_1372712 [Artomyces pyxidatus]|uniref:Uncharacterized protein n=1 Tax=Artomyces pyxidatus TaxID=48021 RepID=A0ACB8SN23_9AGAM|nr:hypothetical protein BV25DRAFT_1372712 [Artomyces pyxidatus]